jgi:hypothetical protein
MTFDEFPSYYSVFGIPSGENELEWPPTMDTPSLRESLTDAIRYWEPLRLAYNAALIIIVLVYFWIGYPASKGALSVNSILVIFFMAVLANVAYCAVYLVDLFAQASGFRETWCKNRWILFAIGLLFAGVLTRFWAIAMFAFSSK